ncbi:MAG: hypothetical protein ACYC2E_09785 [Sulfuricella sp.]
MMIDEQMPISAYMKAFTQEIDGNRSKGVSIAYLFEEQQCPVAHALN